MHHDDHPKEASESGKPPGTSFKKIKMRRARGDGCAFLIYRIYRSVVPRISLHQYNLHYRVVIGVVSTRYSECQKTKRKPL